MTRFLSEALQASEPFFRHGLNRLEAAHGHPNIDIRFSSEVAHATKVKVKQLGLDPRDTTPEELYHALQERIKADDARLTKTLRTQAAIHVSAEADVVAGMIHVLRELPDSKRCFALKTSVLKTIIKSMPPHRAMKQLGYRSLNSFLKHEPPASMLAAAWLCESRRWRQRLLDQYKHLGAGDFEDRRILLMQPDSKRWSELSRTVVSRQRHNIMSLRELGVLIFLPLPIDEVPPGAVTASLTLALHELNEIRADSTFLKLCQVRPDFGKQVFAVANDEPQLTSQLFGQPVPWRLIQRHYVARPVDHGAVPESYLGLEDAAWHPVEQTLSTIEPALTFWNQSAHLGILHHHQPVSFNIVDAALNYCNKQPFEQRIVRYFQRSLWHELLLRYLRQRPIEQIIGSELQPQLAEVTVTT